MNKVALGQDVFKSFQYAYSFRNLKGIHEISSSYVYSNLYRENYNYQHIQFVIKTSYVTF